MCVLAAAYVLYSVLLVLYMYYLYLLLVLLVLYNVLLVFITCIYYLYYMYIVYLYYVPVLLVALNTYTAWAASIVFIVPPLCSSTYSGCGYIRYDFICAVEAGKWYLAVRGEDHTPLILTVQANLDDKRSSIGPGGVLSGSDKDKVPGPHTILQLEPVKVDSS